MTVVFPLTVFCSLNYSASNILKLAEKNNVVISYDIRVYFDRTMSEELL
jgi:hypothetical protein